MSIATPTRLDNVQALRGLAALLVLFSHLIQFEGRTAAQPILPGQLEWGMMGVDLFFVISGFIMVYITRADTDGGGRLIPKFLFARLTRIYPLYWIVSAALFIVWLVRPDWVFSSSPNQPQLLNSLFLIPSNAYPLLEVGWTLVYELMFYLFFAGLLFLPGKWRPSGLLLWAGLILLGNYLDWQSWSPIAFHVFSSLALEFIAGAFTAFVFLRFTGSRTAAVLLLSLGLAGMGVWFFIGGPFEDEWPRVLKLTLPACALILGAAWLDRHKVIAPKAAILLGDWSYSLYLTHLLSLALLAKVWTLLGLTPLPSPLLIVCLVSVSLIVAGVTFKLFEKPLIDRTRSMRKKLFN